MAVVTVTAGCPNVPHGGFGCCNCTGACKRKLTVREKIAALRAEIERLEALPPACASPRAYDVTYDWIGGR